ncbi:MAG: endolytic transglycosylase MltG [Deltaproteobacteria bacterium]|nr:endolytic transglycosylase MltG [Deltaproteobacteria bacterium]
MSRSSFRLALLVVLGTFFLFAACGAWAGYEIVSYPDRRHGGTGRDIVLEIKRGMKFPEIVSALSDGGVIDRPSWFRLYAMHRGLSSKVRAGKYMLRDNLSPREVLDTLVVGVQEVEISVTIPEGKHLREVFEILDQAGIASAGELEEVAREQEWLRAQGIEGETVEGYLFPETYRFRRPAQPRQVLETMVRQHRIVYEELRKKYSRALARLQKQLTWGDREIVIMASIVEKETGAKEERGRVASVFFNRLILPSFPSRRLETDPTIRYGCTIPLVKSAACQKWDSSDRLHRAQLDDKDNLYNTYEHAGLPPGPISNPGRASLAATMDPEDTGYLYFVAKDERTHVFSKTYEEHSRFVEKYQK